MVSDRENDGICHEEKVDASIDKLKHYIIGGQKPN